MLQGWILDLSSMIYGNFMETRQLRKTLGLFSSAASKSKQRPCYDLRTIVFPCSFLAPAWAESPISHLIILLCWSALLCCSFATNFESCDWLKRLIHLLWLVDNTEARLATADNTVQTADDMYTECTILFSLAQAHFAKQIISTQNTYGQVLMVEDKPMSCLEPLRVAERNAKPTIANPKF